MKAKCDEVRTRALLEAAEICAELYKPNRESSRDLSLAESYIRQRAAESPSTQPSKEKPKS